MAFEFSRLVSTGQGPFMCDPGSVWTNPGFVQVDEGVFTHESVEAKFENPNRISVFKSHWG